MLNIISTIYELCIFLWSRKLWWLIPAILVMIFFGGLVILFSSSPIAPLVYPLF